MATKKREFIDPNELMRYINEKHCYSGLPMAAHICTMELLTYAPRVDAVEVVHGRWLTPEEYANQGHNGWLYCSECEQPMREFYGWGYCPNCGAKMDGDRN